MAGWLSLLIIKPVLILASAGLASSLMRRCSASARHLVWLAALLSVLLLPAAHVLIPRWEPIPSHTLLAAPAPVRIVIDVVAEGQGTSTPWSAWLPLIWLAGSLLLLLRAATSQRRMARIAARATCLSTSNPVPVRVTAEVDVPLVCGLLRPLILLPEEAQSWPRERLPPVLAHESIHVIRRDIWSQLCSQLACAVYWPLPLIWWAAANLRRESEQACDDAVLTGGEKPSDYAGHIVQIARELNTAARIPSGGITMIRKNELDRRLAAILSPARNRAAAGPALTAAIAAITLLLLLPTAAWRAPAQPAGPSIKGVVSDPSGARIPGANVMLSFSKSDRREYARTTEAGEFSFAPLPDGFYSIEVTKPGFARHQAGEIQLTADKSLNLDVVLDVGRIQETLQVVAGRTSAPPPPPPAGSAAPTRIRVGGNVQATRLTYQERPSYPADCKFEGVEGTVLLRAVISREGVPMSLEAVNQLVDPRLVKAATDAVKLWRYQPTLLNGVPVEVMSMVQINFTLAK